MPWDTPLDSDVPRLLSRADYDRTRRRAYRVLGAPRDDVALPLIVPPGARPIVQADPSLDYAVPPEAVWQYGMWVIPVDDLVAVYDLRSGAMGTMPLAEAGPLAAAGLVNIIVATPTKFEALSREWWYDTPWGREEAVIFFPPAIRGQYSNWEPRVVTPVPVDREDAPPLVAAPLPHEFIVGGQAPLFVAYLGTSSLMGDSGRRDPKPFGVYRSPVILTGAGDRQGPRFYARGDPLLAADLPPGVAGIWMGHYEDEPHTEWYDDAIQETIETIARSSALSALVTVVGTYITGGGAAGFIQEALRAGTQNLAQSAGESAIQQQAGTVLELPHAQGASGPLEASGFLPSTPTASLNPLDVAQSAPELTASVAAPDETNAALAIAAEATIYLDAMGSVQQLWDMSIRDLVIRAQRTKEAADALRIRLVEMEVEVHSQTWFKVTQKSIDAAMVIAGGAGIKILSDAALAGSLMALTRLGVSAATMALRIENAREVARALRERLEREAAAQPAEAPTTTVVAVQPSAPAGLSRGAKIGLAVGAALVVATVARSKR